MRFSSLIKYVFLILGFFFSSVVLANGTMQDSQIKALAQHHQWLDLLHFHQTGFASGRVAQVDSPGFYLSEPNESGDLSAESELRALLGLLQDPVANNDVLCRYPARLHWLSRHSTMTQLPQLSCEGFDEWLKKLDPKGLTLIFPAAYLNSPSSMYGHTFLRIDRESGQNDLLDYSINFAANTNPDDNELVFTYKGLSGGYPGVFSVLPYYEKVKEYSYLESRDVWEYELALTKEEVMQFARHVWEIKDAKFDYYFFDENCSYQLLTLLDAASERFNFSAAFRWSAIPADTVKEVVGANIVLSAAYRPSTLTTTQWMIDSVSEAQKSAAKALVEEFNDIDDTLSVFDVRAQAEVLDLAYQYSRYLSVRKKSELPGLGKRSISLLSARSKLDENAVFDAVPTPSYRDDEGHDSSRWLFGYGYDGNYHFQDIELRAAYHDHLDNLPGFIAGANLEMFNIGVRYLRGREAARLRLERIKLIDIASFTPRNEFIKPISWHVETGLKRPVMAAEELLPYLNAGGGLSYQPHSFRYYALLDAELMLDDDLNKGAWFGLGPRIGILGQFDEWSTQLELYVPLDLVGAEFSQRAASFALSKSLGAHWQVRARLEATNYEDQLHARDKTTRNRSFSVSVAHYF